jgi:hypothetical protein
MKYTAGIVALFTLAVLVAPVMAAVDQTVPITPNPVGPGNSGPDVYLAVRYFDIGIDIDGSGSSINPSDVRPGFYAFTGERIIHYVLVRDDNGVQDIQLVKWVKDGGPEEGPCDLVEVYDCEGEPGCVQEAHFMAENQDVIEVDAATNLAYDYQIDQIYRCELTVESQWYGSDIYIVAEDTSGASGMSLAENWFFNPALSISVGTSDDDPLTFADPEIDQFVEGATSPNCVLEPAEGREDLTLRRCYTYINEELPEAEKRCDVSFSTNKLVITNTGMPNLWPFIAASNFYATQGMAKCPFTNELHANQFEYRALSGTYDSGWRIMPQYSPNLGCNGIDLGPSTPFNSIYGQCRGGCRIATGLTGDMLGTPGMDILSPGHTIEVALKIVWPTPCIGTFDEGTIYTIVRAV